MKNKNLSEGTYVRLVELFMRNDSLDYASYFLCQMDKLRIKIPRQLLDLFLDYSINNKIFDNEKITFKNPTYGKDKVNNKKDEFVNKFDQYDPQDEMGYLSYLKKRENLKNRNDIHALYAKLKIDSKPFFPKETFEKVKSKLAEIDPSKVKEYVPKNYRVVKKEEKINDSS